MNKKKKDAILDPHNLPMKLEYSLRALENDKAVSKKNKEIIKKYDDHNLINQCSIPTRAKYINSLRNFCQHTNKDFDKMSKEDLQKMWAKVLGCGKWSPPWVANMGKTLKTFYRWLKETDDFPPEIKWLKPKNEKPEPINANLTISIEEIKTMADATDHPRDKAFLKIGWESGCRIGELLTLKIKDVEFLQNSCFLNIGEGSKTRDIGGKRKVFCFVFANDLKQWILQHPMQNNPDAPVFCSLTRKLGKRETESMGLCYNAAMKLYHNAYKKTLKDSGKPRNIHWLRHSSISYFYQTNDFTPSELSMKYWGIPHSQMLNRYAHLDSYKTAKRISGEDDVAKEAPKPVKCSTCGAISDGLSQYCSCGKVLKPGFERNSTIAMQFLYSRLADSVKGDPVKEAKLNELVASVMG